MLLARLTVKSIRVSTLLLAALLLAIACSPHVQTSRPNAAADLGGTSWQLVKFQGSDDKTLTPDDKSKYTIAFGTDGGVSARIDCNRGRGTWKSSGPNQLQFGPLALTRAMCPPGSLHDRIARDWEFVRSYTMREGHLFLSLMADGGIYEFEPMGGLKSAAPKSAVASTGPVKYECTRAGGGNDTLIATFYQTTPAMVLVERGNHTHPAFQVPVASGAKYEGQDLMFWDARGEARVTWSGVELKCKPR
jgi:heat shock protein HslJ